MRHNFLKIVELPPIDRSGNKLKFSARRAAKLLFRKLGLVEEEVVYFEGGLGSQILAYLEFLDKSETANLLKQPSPICDTSYFQQPIGNLQNGLTIRPWALERYGLQLIDLHDFETSAKRKYFKSRLPYAEKFKVIHGKQYRTYATRFSNRFVSDSELAKFAERQVGIKLDSGYNLSGTLDCCVVHVRRGDYLQVSSHLVSLNSYLVLLRKIKSFLPPSLVFFSDSEIDPKFKDVIIEEFFLQEIIFCEGDGYAEGEVHDFMRKCKILITGNSTFSLTAGLLAEQETIVFSPITFYSETFQTRTGNPFISIGEFFLFM